MNDETLEIILRARDEMSASLKNVQNELGSLNEKANVAGRGVDFLKSALSGIATGVGIAAFFQVEQVFSRLADAIPQLITQGMAFGATVRTIQAVSGGTAVAVSRLVGDLTYMGVSTDNLGMRLLKLSTAVYGNEGEFQKLGIVTRDTNGKLLDSVTILDNVRKVWSTTADGVDKAALSQKLFGRGAADLVEYLNLSNAQVAKLNTEMDALGVTMNEKGVLQAKAASQEFNLLGLSVQGLANKLFTDVAPALQSAVNGIAMWVEKNSSTIAQFAASAANFVLGVISALTGATFKTVTFADSLGALATAGDASSTSLDNNTTAAKANTTAYDNATKAIDKQVTALGNLDAASQRRYEASMKGLSAELTAQLNVLDAEAKRRTNAEQDVANKRALADATKALGDAQKAAGQNPNDPAAQDALLQAQRRVGDIHQQMADQQFQRDQDTRKAQIKAVQTYVDAIVTAEKDSTNKRALLVQLHKDATTLASKLTADRESGDQQAVADDLTKIEAVKSAIVRAAEAARTKTKTDALMTAKAKIADEKAAFLAAFGAGGAVPVGMTAGLGVISAALLSDDRHGGVGGGTGLVGAFKGAQAAGMEFGQKIKDVLGGIGAMVPGLVTAIGSIVTAFGGLVDWVSHNKGTIELVMVMAGAASGNLALAAAGIGLGAANLNDPNSFSPIEDALGLSNKPKFAGPKVPNGQMGPITKYGTESLGVPIQISIDTTTIANIIDARLGQKYRLGR